MVVRRDIWGKRLKKAIKDAQLVCTQKLELEIWKKLHKRNPSTRLPILL